MGATRSFLRPPRQRRQRHRNEPGAQLFSGIRIRLTLWYCGVLAAALVLFGIGLYFGVQHFLLASVDTDAAAHAQAHVGQWLASPYSLDSACSYYNPQEQLGQHGPPPGQGYTIPELVACFNPQGNLIQADGTSQLPSAFLNSSLVQPALQQGHAADIVNAGGTSIYRYAQAVPGNLGVVVIGEYINGQESALTVLLILLFALGGVALLGAGFGGLFLAARAMVPARLAFTRQQQFIGDAAHELRTPLTLMRADAEVLLRSREHMNPEDAALLEDIVAEANHMSTMANSMLALARLDAGTQHREYDVVSLDEIALAGVRRVSAFAEQKGVSVHLENSDHAFVIGDSGLLEQALLVLLDNAIKYNMPGGQVIVRSAVNDGKAQLEVSDTGIGIPAEHLPHLGERFYRVDKARSREAGGTGLGLSIAHRIAALHDGSLTINSMPDQGTTVTLQLPLAQSTPSHEASSESGNISPLSERIH